VRGPQEGSGQAPGTSVKGALAIGGGEYSGTRVLVAPGAVVSAAAAPGKAAKPATNIPAAATVVGRLAISCVSTLR
jgi:hypothetical protein